MLLKLLMVVGILVFAILVFSETNAEKAACRLDGQQYPAGPFIHKCRSCWCFDDGYRYCVSQCHDREVKCKYGVEKYRVRVEVSRGCYCIQAKCRNEGCHVDNSFHKVGKFQRECQICDCRADGTYQCRSQCPQLTDTCKQDQEREETKYEVSAGCHCKKITCKQVLLGKQVCRVRGKEYPIGPFTFDCQYCRCYNNGRWRCTSSCPVQRVACGSGQRVVERDMEVTRGCFCKKLLCEDFNQPSCYVDGKRFAVGQFTHDCQDCLCHENGFWKCQSKCRSSHISCTAGQRVETMYKVVSDGCRCPVLTCTAYVAVPYQ